MYADSITKKFLAYGTNTAEAGPNDTRIGDHQDPTYLGFQIRIVQSDQTENLTSLDTFPHGLFTVNPETDPYSCYNYLRNRGEYKRAAYILSFENDFLRLVQNCPWFFVKVSGLSDSWKIDPKKNFRGFDKKITIDTLESIDMKMTYLIDLYRKATYDAAYARWAVPDHMRYFKLEVIVSEIRHMKIGDGGANGSLYSGPVAVEGASSYEEFDSLSVFAASGDKIIGLWDTNAPWSAGSFVKFRYEQCEFDFMSEAPSFLESVESIPVAPAANKITIKTNIIRESNTYGLLGAIVDETEYWWKYGEDAKNKSFGYPHPLADSNNSNAPIPDSITLEPLVNTDYLQGMEDRYSRQLDFNDGSNAFSDSNNAEGSTDFADTPNAFADSNNAEGSTDFADTPNAFADSNNAETNEASTNTSNVYGASSSPAAAAEDAKKKTAAGQLISNVGRAAIAGATDFARSLVMSQINSVLLGNVYGLSPLSLVSTAQSILNNPVGAVQNLLARYSSPATSTEMAKKVILTAAEVQLVKDIIGKAAEINGVANAKANLGKSTATADSINKNVVGAISDKPDQTAPSTKKSGQGKTILSSFAKSASSLPSSVVFESPEIVPARLGNVYLDSAAG
jgi:uncharacterized protein YoxC